MKALTHLKELNLPAGQYAIYGSALLGLFKLREIPNIDVIVTDELWTTLKKDHLPDDEGFIRFSGLKFSNWWFAPTHPLTKLISEAETFDGLPYVPLKYVREYKNKLTDEKNKNDVKLIDEFLKDKKPRNLGYEDYKEYLDVFIRELTLQFRASWSGGITGAMLFGSVARGQASGDSDIDIFIFYDGGLNFATFWTVLIYLRQTKQYKDLVKRGINPEIYPFFLGDNTRHDYLWVALDATTEGKILYDPKGDVGNWLTIFRNKINELKGQRTILPNGKSCWTFPIINELILKS